jgi:hypothetical protein
MNIKRSRTGLASTGALVVIVFVALSSCSEAGDQNAKEQTPAAQSAPEQNASASAAPSTSATNQDASSQNARALLKSMSDYLAAQKNIALSYDSIFEVVSKDKQKLQLATSGTAVINRPDKIRTTRQSGFSDTEMVFDGKTVTFLGKGQNAYIQAEAPGTIDTLIDQLRDKFHRQLPGADLLVSNPFDALMTDVTDVKDLGSGVVNGKECDHLAFRAKDTDWQIWIAQGKDPYPCRYVITSKGVDQAPQFTMQIRDWKTGAAAGSADFAFSPPAGAKRMDAKDLQALKDTSDLPENYRTGEAQ